MTSKPKTARAEIQRQTGGLMGEKKSGWGWGWTYWLRKRRKKILCNCKDNLNDLSIPKTTRDNKNNAQENGTMYADTNQYLKWWFTCKTVKYTRSKTKSLWTAKPTCNAKRERDCTFCLHLLVWSGDFASVLTYRPETHKQNLSFFSVGRHVVPTFMQSVVRYEQYQWGKSR